MPEKRIQQLRDLSAKTLQPLPPEADSLGFGGGVAGVQPDPQTQWDGANQRMAREDKATTGDYIGSIWRQDGLVDGAVASLVGSQLMPDESYNPHTPEVWAELTQGISPEYHAAFFDAHSAPHASLIRDRLVQKQEDLTRLGDMGVPGTIGRLALNVLMPDQILAAMAGGWVTRGARLGELALAGRKVTGVAKAAAQAGVKAEQATLAASGTAKALGIGAGGAGNAAFEQIRQNMNFEDDSSEVVFAGLLGAALTTPFAFAGRKTEQRIAAAATREKAAMQAMRDLDQGKVLDVETAKILDDTLKAHATIRDLQAGRLTPDEARARLDEQAGLRDQEWLNQHREELSAKGNAMLDQMFPESRVVPGVRKNLGIDDKAPLQLGHTPGAKNWTADSTIPMGQSKPDAPVAGLLGHTPGTKNWTAEGTLKVNKHGQITNVADVATARAELEARFATVLRDLKKHDPAAAKKLNKAEWVDNELAKLAGGESPASIKDQIKAARAREIEQRRLDREATAKIDQTLLDSTDKAPKATSKASQDADLEARFASQIDEATGAPNEAQATTPAAAPDAPAVAPPKAPADPFPVGKYVEFTKRNSEDEFDGIIESVDGEFVKIKDDNEVVHTVHESRIFKPVEAPSGFLKGSVGSAQIGAIQDVALQTTAMSKARLDIFATLNRSDSDEVRKLVFDLVKDPIQVDDVSAQGWTASEYKSHLRRTIAGAFHRESRQAANEAAKLMGIPIWARMSGVWDGEFHSLVSRVTRGEDLSATHADILPHLQKAATAQGKVYKALIDEARKAGVKGAEDVADNALYVNRIWDHKGIRNAELVHGEDAVHDLLARAIKVPGLTGDVGKAKSFLRTVRKLEFSPVMQNIHLYAQDMASLRKTLAAEGKLDDADVNNIVDMMFESTANTGGDAGQAKNLKFRFDLDETMSVKTPEGPLRISDLFENDSRVLVDLYTNSMAGHIGLAKKGIKSQAEFMERVRKATDELDANPAFDKGRAKRDLQLLQDIYSNITGKPMSTQDFSPSARLAATMRGYSRSLMLGQLGLTAAFEMFQAAGYMGVKTALRQMPSFRQFWHAIRSGHIPDSQLARDVELMAGFGHEMDMSYARQHEIDDSGVGRMITKAESGANKASHAVDLLSGNASMTSMTRQWAGMMAVQDMHDFATGAKKLTDDHRKRFVGNGMDHFEVDSVLADMKSYTTANKGGKVETVDWEKWSKESPDTYEKFQLGLSRKVRDAVQDQDLGETMPFMHTTLGKVVAELKTFMLVSHAKNFLKNLHYRDGTTLQVYMVSIVGNAMAYMTQTSINYAHDPDKLREMLTMERVAQAVVARTAALGISSLGIELGYNVATGGETLLSGGSANTGNRTLVPPSLLVAQRLAHAPSILSGIAAPWATTTQQEARELTGLVPNLFGVRNLGNAIVNSLPKSEPQPGD
jgi:hypothetical protein